MICKLTVTLPYNNMGIYSDPGSISRPGSHVPKMTVLVQLGWLAGWLADSVVCWTDRM